MATVLYVRAKSGLEPEELEKRLLERRPRFLEVPGLVQKVYGRDGAAGDVCGVYFFESREALAHFRETELAKMIPTAYEVTEIRMEVYDMLYPPIFRSRADQRISSRQLFRFKAAKSALTL